MFQSFQFISGNQSGKKSKCDFKKDLATLWNNAPRAAFSWGARATFEGCNFDLQTENIMKGVIPMKKMILGDFNGRCSALFYVIETRDFFSQWLNHNR